MTPSLLKLPTEIRLNIYDILCPASVDIRLYDGFGSSERGRILAAIYRKSRTQSIIHHRQQDWHPRMTSREDFLMPRSIDSLLKTCRLLNVEVGMHVYRKLDVRMWLLLGSRGSYRQFCHQDRRLVVPTAPVMLHPGARLMRCLSIDLIGIGCLRNNCWYHDWDGFSLVKRQKVFALAELLNWCVNLEKLNIWFHGNEKSSSIKKAGSNPEQHSLSCVFKHPKIRCVTFFGTYNEALRNVAKNSNWIEAHYDTPTARCRRDDVHGEWQGPRAVYEYNHHLEEPT